MLELAYNLNGEPFEAPPTTAAWRVRKLKAKGAPEVVFGRDGLPLFLPMDADIEDLRRESRDTGKFRLDPVDDHNRQIPNAPASYVCVHPIERTPEPAAPAPAPPPAPTAAGSGEMMQQLVSALLESQKQHTELARMYVSQFPVVANSLAGVVRSAGDAGLTARVPLVIPATPEPKPDQGAQREEDDDEEPDDESDDDEISDETDGDPLAVEVEPQPEYSWARVAQTFADHVSPHVGPLLEGLPGLAAMLGAKRAATATDAARGPDRSDPAPAEAESRAPSGPALAFDAGLLVRINAIKARLTVDEREFAQMLIDEIAPEELPVWMGRLRSMSLDEAVAYVREKYRQGQAAADRARPIAPSAATSPSAAPGSAPPRAAVRPTAPSVAGEARRDRRQPMRPISESAAPAAVGTSARATRRSTPSNGLGLLDEGTQAHLAAIDQALTLDEAAALRKQFAALPPRERASWVATLVLLPVADAVAAIRAQLAAADAPAQPANPGPEMPDAPAATGAITSAPSAPPSLGGAGSAGASDAAPADPASTHDRPTTSALATEPLDASPTAPTELAHVGIERNADLHLAEVERALTPDERVQMHAMFSRLSPDERDVWLDKLLAAPPSHGTAMLRDALGDANAQPRTTAPPVNGPPGAIAAPSDAAPAAPEYASAQHAPGIEITELDGIADPDHAAELDEAELDETAELDGTADPDDATELDDSAEIIELDETAELDATAQRENDPTRAADPAHHAHRADDPTAPHGADPARADRNARTTKESPPAPSAAGAASATADPDPGDHLAAIEAALTLAEKMRAHELAAQWPAAELRRWYAELLRLSVPDAVAKIRAELARNGADPRATKKGGAS